MQTYKIPGLGLEIMAHNMKQVVSIGDTGHSYKQEYHNRLETDSEVEKAKELIEKQYPGQRWRIPDGKELRLLGHLAELGLDLSLADRAHLEYYKPVTSTEWVEKEYRMSGRLCLVCVFANPKENEGNPVRVWYHDTSTSSHFRYGPEIRLVRSI